MGEAGEDVEVRVAKADAVALVIVDDLLVPTTCRVRWLRLTFSSQCLVVEVDLL